jgi:tRNA/rRNA methyltransferase
VAVCLYELVRAPASPQSPQAYDSEAAVESAANPVTAADLERVTALLNEVLVQTEYTRRHAANCDPAQVRRLVRRMGADAVDAPVWMGILRQVLWKLGVGRQE